MTYTKSRGPYRRPDKGALRERKRPEHHDSECTYAHCPELPDPGSDRCSEHQRK